MILFWVAASEHGRLGCRSAFYLWGMLLGALLISQFWTLANGHLRSAAGEAVCFGFIGGGVMLGGMPSAPVSPRQ